MLLPVQPATTAVSVKLVKRRGGIRRDTGRKVTDHFMRQGKTRGFSGLGKAELFHRTQLKKGTKIEMEHTDDPKTARKIAKDHLREHPKYYIYLERMEKEMMKK